MTCTQIANEIMNEGNESYFIIFVETDIKQKW